MIEVEENVITIQVMKGKDGAGVPTGGTAGQILAKKSGTNYDTEWVTGGGGTGAVWGSITGTLSNQTDLSAALAAKADSDDLGALAALDSASLTANVTGTLPVANGGTGATTAADARTNLGLGAMATMADAASDGSEYVRKNGAWAVSSGGGTGAVWGSITGTLSNQTDLSAALAAKANSADLGALAALDSASLTANVTGTLPVANGGTGATTVADARENLGLGDLAVKDSATLTTDVTGTLPIANGGTGATTAADARENLGLGDLAVKDSADLTSDVTGALPLANGGTGATTAADARTALGLGAMATMADALSDGSEYVRKNGAWAVSSGGGGGGGVWGAITGTLSNQTDLSAALAAKADSADLGTLAALDSVSLTANVTGTLPVANGGTGATAAADARDNLGLGDLAVKDTVTLTTDVTGTLPVANGGTGATTAADARDALGLGDLAVKDSVDLTADVTGTLPVANGGTGATTAAGAREDLGLGDLAVKDSVTLTTDVTGTLPIANGGTGATTAADARDALGLGDLAVKDSVTLTTDVTGTLPVANGGTGATTTADALTALGAMSANPSHINIRAGSGSTPVLSLMQYSVTSTFSYLAELAEGRLHFAAVNGLYYGLDTTSPILTGNSSGLLALDKGGTGATTAADARENLGLGDLAVKDSVTLTTDVTGTLSIANGGTGATTAADARDALGLGDLAVKDSVDLTADVTGTLPVANGGTGASTAAGARTALGITDIALKPDYTYSDTDLTAGTSSLDTGKLYFYYS